MSNLQELAENYNKTRCTKLSALLVSYQHLITFQKRGELSREEIHELQSQLPKNLLPNHNKCSRLIIMLVSATQIQITNGVTNNFLEFLSQIGRHFMHNNFTKVRDEEEPENNRQNNNKKHHKRKQRGQEDSGEYRNNQAKNSRGRKNRFNDLVRHDKQNRDNPLSISDSEDNDKRREHKKHDSINKKRLESGEQNRHKEDNSSKKHDKEYKDNKDNSQGATMKNKQFGDKTSEKHKSKTEQSENDEDDDRVRNIKQSEWPIKIEEFSWKWPIRLFDERTPCQYIYYAASKNSWISRIAVKDLEQYRNQNTLQLGFERSKWQAIEHTIEAMRMNNAFVNNKAEIDEFLKQLKIEASKPVDDSKNE